MNKGILKLGMLNKQHAAGTAPTFASATMAEEIEIVKQWLAQRMFPETLQLFEEEASCSYRRTSTSTTEVPSWTCIICDKIFTKKGSAKRHCDTAHLDERAAERVECPQCFQKFNRRDDLYSHIRRIHRDSGGEDLVQSLIHSTTRRQNKRFKSAPAAAAAAAPAQQELAPPATTSSTPTPMLLLTPYCAQKEHDGDGEEEGDKDYSPASSAAEDADGGGDYLSQIGEDEVRYDDQVDVWDEEALSQEEMDAVMQGDIMLTPRLMFGVLSG